MLWDAIRLTSDSIHPENASKEVVNVRVFVNLGPSPLSAVRIVRASLLCLISLELELLHAGHPMYTVA